MNKNRKLVVKMNGKKTNQTKQNLPKKMATKISHQENSFASKKIENRNQLPPSVRQGFPSEVKRLIFAIVSAVFVGLLLGFFMLDMFGNMNRDHVEPPPTSTNHDVKQSEKQAVNKDKESAESRNLPTMTAFVLQGGVFSGRANAEVTEKEFRDAGFGAMIWERDQQFYVLVGIASTQNDITRLANQIKQRKLETYVKKWTVQERKLDITKEEYEWLSSFQNIWNEAIAQHKEQKDIKKEWEQLLKNTPKQSKVLSPLNEQIQHDFEKLAKTDEKDVHAILLKIWDQYEKVIATAS